VALLEIFRRIKITHLVANIPYYITGAILEKFLEHGPRPTRMVLLVQKEVAERICARDGKESILSISVKAFGTPHIIAKVPPGAFTPPPTVDSAILSIEHISNIAFTSKNLDVKRFFSIVKAGFAHKRKLLARNLEDVLSKEEIGAIWEKAGFDKNVRAEDLKVEEWLKI
jgi:16S rRNA (adenine1518-N6/adenine1519-N6)-dimethyltransferase